LTIHYPSIAAFSYIFFPGGESFSSLKGTAFSLFPNPRPLNDFWTFVLIPPLQRSSSSLPPGVGCVVVFVVFELTQLSEHPVVFVYHVKLFLRKALSGRPDTSTGPLQKLGGYATALLLTVIPCSTFSIPSHFSLNILLPDFFRFWLHFPPCLPFPLPT